jgi:hypothetical protein
VWNAVRYVIRLYNSCWTSKVGIEKPRKPDCGGSEGIENRGMYNEANRKFNTAPASVREAAE